MRTQSPLCTFLGYGYVARHSAPLLAAKGFRLIGTTRSRTQAQPSLVRLLSPMDAELASSMEDASLIVISPPPGEGQNWALAQCQQIGKTANPMIIYLSSTAVYGDHQGQWLDETAPLLAQDAVGLARISAEREWLQLCAVKSWPCFILRLSGIYGQGRNALLRVRQGEAQRILKPGHYFSRIHVADIASTIAAMAAAPEQAGIYHLSDDEPAESHMPIEYAAQLLGVDLPPAIAYAPDNPAISVAMHRFYIGNKRLKNDKVKQQLGIKLAYPNYKQGLLALYETDIDK